MPKFFAYKFGDVMSGNWSWAVGSGEPLFPKRPYSQAGITQVMTVNHAATNHLRLDPEEVAKIAAKALSEELI